jgi:3',5'-cyclic AMP phosphodiesterase CpdA
MRKILISTITGIMFLVILIMSSCGKKTPKTESVNFSFVYMTDIHLQPERYACEGFDQAMDTINAINPDFVITGGDLIMDALGQKYSRADSLYNLYRQEIKKLRMPVYNTMGNHEIYGLYSSVDSVRKNPEYLEKMFESRLGNSYYSFMNKGWKFIIINSVEETKTGSYIGFVDTTQLKWIKDELVHTDKSTPIVLSTHIPFITAFTQKYEGSTIGNDSSLVVANSKEVIELFKGFNLKAVMQGHLHTFEDIYIDGVHFITGGAVCGAWWQGANRGFEEGFTMVSIEGNSLKCEYKDYGWNVKK